MTVAVSTYATVYVYAESPEEAKEKAMRDEWEDIELEDTRCVFEEVESVEVLS